MLLFVYGTLRPPAGGPAGDTHYHHRIADLIVSSSTAVLPGAQLFDCGRYPGVGPARRGEAVAVVGDLLEITDDALEIADEIEGHPHFYVRREEVVFVGDDRRTAWVYWAPDGVLTDATPIASNDWFTRDRRTVDRSIEEQLEQDIGRIAANEGPE